MRPCRPCICIPALTYTTKVNTHASFFKDNVLDPAAYAHFSSGPYKSLDHFIDSMFTQRSYKKEDMLTYVIYEKDTTQSERVYNAERGTVAGMISLVNVDVENRSAEVGILQVLPPCRSRGLATKVGRLLVWYGFLPASRGGIGLARMEWHVASGNGASGNVARKLGFKEIGLLKYERLLKDGIKRGKVGNGRPSPPDSPEGDLWRDLTLHALSWDEWAPRPEYAEFRALDIEVDR